MATVSFTANIQRHVSCPPVHVDGDTVHAVLTAAFRSNPAARSYVLDEQGTLRPHMVIFVNGKQIRDRVTLSDVVSSDAEIHVMQALSGG